jgi:hypothetical protein
LACGGDVGVRSDRWDRIEYWMDKEFVKRSTCEMIWTHTTQLLSNHFKR